MILIVGLGLIATYTGYVLGQFRLQYPHVHNMADAGEVLMGRFGRELFGNAQLIVLVFVMGSHILTFSIMMNTLTNHGTCTIVFNIVGMALMFLGNLPRTLKNVSWLSIACKYQELRPGKGEVGLKRQLSLTAIRYKHSLVSSAL